MMYHASTVLKAFDYTGFQMVYLFILVFLPLKDIGESGYFLYLGGFNR